MQEVRHLVLGARGCGVFGNDPRLVARIFSELLHFKGEFNGVFEQVVFAIVERSPEKPIARIFAEAFA